MIEVKPVEAGQDMAVLEAYVRSVAMDGLVWGEQFRVVDVAYGIQKLIVQCVIEDEKARVARRRACLIILCALMRAP